MTAPALTLHRARSAAPFASRGALAAALDWWREEAGAEGEWLLVPRLRLVAPSPAHSTPSALARQLDRALGAVREAATVDPAPGTWPSGALRFTRPERWLAWLAVRLATPDARGPRECAPLPESPAKLRSQLRASYAREPRLLLALVRTLTAAGEFQAWAESWSPADIAAIREALTVHFAVAPQDLLDDAPYIPAKTQPEVPAQVTTGTDPALPAPQFQRSDAQAEARRIVAASTLPPGLSTLDPQRRFLARLLIALPGAPALAPQLAQVLAAAVAGSSPTTRSDRVFSQPDRQPGNRIDQTRPQIRSASALPGRPKQNQSTISPVRSSAPTAARRNRDIPTDLPQLASAAPTPHRRARPARRAEPTAIAQPALFESRFGGLLFLLNAFTALDLYPDFTRPLDPRLEPSPCWLLGRIGHHWFGRCFARDPLARWLASRAVPGALPEAWRIDPDWEPTALHPLRLRHHGLACEWDRRGFLAKARPLRPREHRLPAPPLKVARKLRRLPLETEPWLAGFLSYLDWRLSAADLHRADLCLPAQLHWQDDCASLGLPLAQLPIALRMAGLDRDPGWLPAEGCNFRFEFT